MEDPDLGPLMNEKAVAKQEAQVADALAHGARLLTGGARSPLGPLFYEPTVLADAPDDALIFREETFGPSPRSPPSTARPRRWPAPTPPNTA
jgi:aspartate-semialdehyde dehydrogenase